MSKTTFNMGEWCILPVEEDKDYIRIRGVQLGLKHKIANVPFLRVESDPLLAKRFLNESMKIAQLISAAPELLEALEALDADWTKSFPEGPNATSWAALSIGGIAESTLIIWRNARAAIAKAKGV